ncbi:MAG TPA: nicotinamide riboside transporter PnuC [Candidatus Saccharimonadales bacterium]|nr:nicotinamide riboside transporter PnuC [Candidatus Saccharimonadales bacterium]
MNTFLAFFDVSNTFFTLLGYPISYLEFTGTLFNLASVLLVAKRNIWTWPVATIGVILFGVLFYQIQLYADFFEQIYYFITGLWGWYLWQTGKEKANDRKVKIVTNSQRTNLYWAGGIVIGSIVLTWVLVNLNAWVPTLFPMPASLPGLDATTTVMSFAATILMILRRVESWILWIAVDVVAVGLYYYKAVPFIALLYLVFLGIAISGFVSWNKASKQG